MGLSLLVGKYVSQMQNVTFSMDAKGVSHHSISSSSWGTSTTEVAFSNTSNYSLAWCQVLGISNDTEVYTGNVKGRWRSLFAPKLSVLTSAVSWVCLACINTNNGYTGYVGFKISKSGCYLAGSSSSSQYSASSCWYWLANHNTYREYELQCLLLK